MDGLEWETRVLYCACNKDNKLRGKFFVSKKRVEDDVSDWNQSVPPQQRLKVVPVIFNLTRRGSYELSPDNNIVIDEFFKQFCIVK